MHEAERGSFDLHRGRPLLVSGPPDSSTAAALVASVEGLTPQTLEKLRVMSPGVVRLAVRRPQTHRYNGLGKGRNNRPQVISLPVPDVVSPAELWKLASTVGSGSVFAPGARAASGPEIAGLTLTRWGDLLPAVVSVTVDDPEQELLTGELKSGAILTVTTQQVEAMASAEHPELTEVSVGPVPLGDAENALFVSFRETTGNTGHVAVLIGNQEEWPDPVPVRMHSACLAGDVFGSRGCDCGNQLRQSLQAFASDGGGVLLYLGQEGWGITLASQMRAYSMQQAGLNRDQAHCAVDVGGTDRRHEAVTEILRILGVTRFRLLTNSRHTLQTARNGDVQVIDGRPPRDLQAPQRAIPPAEDRPPGRWLGQVLSES